MRLPSILVLGFGLTVASACGAAVGDDTGNGDGDGGTGGDGGGGGGDASGGGDDACKKIDLLISVDPSGSMAQELAAMSTIFGDFANALLAVNADFENFRTGVVDSCPRPAAFNVKNQANAACNFASGQSYIDSAAPSMVQEFQCVGDLNRTFDCNVDNDEDEQPIKAAIAALDGTVNPNFLRNDALLVVMAITDEDEEMVLDGQTEETFTGPQLDGATQGLYDQLVAYKGDVKRMVFIDIAGGQPAGCANGTYGAANPAPVMNGTADRFIAQQRGVKHDICQGNLDQALTDAMTVITQACDEFEPPVE